MIIQHNMMANNIVRNHKCLESGQEKSVEKLSSGYKINRAADGAAELAISEKMRSMIRGLNRASSNAQDGISLLQTAEGALNETHSLLQRMRELSVQAANGTNTEQDRSDIQDELDQLVDEIDRIAEDTEFNTMKLLDGTLEDPSSVQQSSVSNRAIAVDAIVKDGTIDGVTFTTAQSNNLTTALKDTIVPKAVNALLDTFSVFDKAVQNRQVSSQIGLQIYKENSNTLAYVANYYSYDSSNKIINISLNLSVNVKTLQFDGNDMLTTASQQELETTIVHEMVHALMDDVLTNGMVGATNGVLNASNQFPGWFKEGMAQAAAGGGDWVRSNGDGLNLNASSSEDTISNTLQNSAYKLGTDTTASKYGTGYLACMYLGYLAAGSPATISSTTLGSGVDKVLTDLTNGKSLNDIIKDISGGQYTSYTDFEEKFGDSESASFVSKLLTQVGTGNGGLVADLSTNDLLQNYNPTPSSGVYGVDDSQEFVTSSVTNRNWNTGGSGGVGSSGGSSGGGSGGSGGTGGTGGSGGTGSIFSSGGLYLQIGAQEYQTMAISIGDMHAAKLGVSRISATNQESAGDAIDLCDKAIAKVSKERSNIGASINRLEHTIANLDNTAENTQAAESRMRDTDMASEMVAYSKYNVLMQAAQSVLSQANQNPQGVLNLLRA